MQEWLHALSLEVEVQGRRLRAAGGGRLDAAATGATGARDRMVERLARNQAGLKVGEWSRQGAAFLQSLPGLSLFADTAVKTSCTDLLLAAHRAQPGDPLTTMQLVDGLRAAERHRFIVKWARTSVDPTGRLAAEGLRLLAQVGAGNPAAPRLIRSAHGHAAVRVRTAPAWSDLHALSRAYLAAGKPRLALHYSDLARHAARRELAAAEDGGAAARSAAAMLAATGGLGRSLALVAVADARATAWFDERVRADPTALPAPVLARKREGAALAVSAAAHLALGQRAQAERAVAAALDRGMTTARVVRAAMLDPDLELSFGRRVAARRAELDQIALVDRRLYFGAARRTVGVGGAVAAEQTRKTSTWARRGYASLRRLSTDTRGDPDGR
ncbi:MAG: hypothetical protein HZB46_03865 [Solirubrobacterales bacterium]|nr:hypothetical protein [Solirubrobacterales bacterium]